MSFSLLLKIQMHKVSRNTRNARNNSIRFNHLLMSLALIDILFIFFYSLDIISRVWLPTVTTGWYASLFRYVTHPLKHIMLSCSIYMVVAISAERKVPTFLFFSLFPAVIQINFSLELIFHSMYLFLCI